jgi:hypothetical protein
MNDGKNVLEEFLRFVGEVIGDLDFIRDVSIHQSGVGIAIGSIGRKAVHTTFCLFGKLNIRLNRYVYYIHAPILVINGDL